jgi:hypothetical protein
MKAGTISMPTKAEAAQLAFKFIIPAITFGYFFVFQLNDCG